MVILIFAKIGATEGDFQGEAVDNVQLLPQSDLHRERSTLAAPSRSFWTSKEQSLKWKTAQLFFMSMGKTCSFFDPSLAVQPSE